jgi:hypothetical protein
MKCDYEPVQAIPCTLCVFDIMGNHPTGETFPLCKIPARYLLSTSSLLNRPVENYIPIYPTTHLHNIIYINIRGLKIPITSSGRIWSVLLAISFLPDRDLHGKVGEYSYRASTSGRLRRPTRCPSSEGMLKVFDQSQQCTGYHGWKGHTDIGGNCLLSLLLPVPELFLLPVGEFNKHTCTPDWPRNNPLHDQPISQTWAPHSSLCHLKMWDAYLGNDYYPTYAAWKPTSGGAWMI